MVSHVHLFSPILFYLCMGPKYNGKLLLSAWKVNLGFRAAVVQTDVDNIIHIH